MWNDKVGQIPCFSREITDSDTHIFSKFPNAHTLTTRSLVPLRPRGDRRAPTFISLVVQSRKSLSFKSFSRPWTHSTQCDTDGSRSALHLNFNNTLIFKMNSVQSWPHMIVGDCSCPTVHREFAGCTSELVSERKWNVTTSWIKFASRSRNDLKWLHLYFSCQRTHRPIGPWDLFSNSYKASQHAISSKKWPQV